MAEVEYDMHTSPACTYARITGEVDPCLEVGPCLMDVVALGLHYGARTGLYKEDPRSQKRGAPVRFPPYLPQGIKRVNENSICQKRGPRRG
jgi:hypothetical protein